MISKYDLYKFLDKETDLLFSNRARSSNTSIHHHSKGTRLGQENMECLPSSAQRLEDNSDCVQQPSRKISVQKKVTVPQNRIGMSGYDMLEF